MKTNRSVPPLTVVPILVYPDVRAAVTFLTTAFGFVERTRIAESHRAVSPSSFGSGWSAPQLTGTTFLDRALACGP
jgi:hypothetical protein